MTQHALTLVVILAFCAEALRPAAGDEPTDRVPPVFELYLPEDLGTVAFGDPLFVPLALVNPDNQEHRGPSLSSHGPDLVVTIRAGDSSSKHHYNQGFGGGFTELFPPRSAQSTVLVLRPWTPLLSEALRKSGRGGIEFELGVRSDSPPWNRLGSLVEKSGFLVSGSSITDAGMDRLMQISNEFVSRTYGSSANPVDESTLGSYPLSLPFSSGVTPLSLLDPLGHHHAERTDPSSEFFSTAESFVRENSGLDRMLKIHVLLHRFRNAATIAQWESVHGDFMPLLAQCAPWEYLYYVESLSGTLYQSKINGDEFERLRERLASTFPMNARLFARKSPATVMAVLDERQD